ncbi:beta-taxilin-like [Haemaphysalis longicornis]
MPTEIRHAPTGTIVRCHERLLPRMSNAVMIQGSLFNHHMPGHHSSAGLQCLPLPGPDEPPWLALSCQEDVPNNYSPSPECRQAASPTVEDECLLRIRDEEEKRREVASKFQTTLLDITAVLEENQARSLQLREENAQLAQRLRALIEHYDVWEKNVDTVLQQKDLQVQVAATHLARVQAQLEQERHSSAIEKQLMLKQVAESQRQTTELATRESNLREELTSHASKYEEFQGALAQSNNLFRSFKQDMDKMTKKIKKLEKETTQWKLRWEASNKALADLTAEKQSRDKELLAAQQQVITLEKQCHFRDQRDLVQQRGAGCEPAHRLLATPARHIRSQRHKRTYYGNTCLPHRKRAQSRGERVCGARPAVVA